MASDLPVTNGHNPSANGTGDSKVPDGEGKNSFSVKTGLARMLKGGVIMDVVNAEQVNRPLSCHRTIRLTR